MQALTIKSSDMILAKITGKLLCTVFLLDITFQLFLPKLDLLIWVAILMLADLVTGILKAKFNKEVITSDRLRNTVIKFLQYFGSIGLIMVLANQNNDNKKLLEALSWARDGVTILIIYIECLSIFENLYAMDTKTKFAIYVIQPIYWLLSFAVRNNRFQQTKEKLEEEEQTRGKGNGERHKSFAKKQEHE